jgi:hypothetical protein
VRPFFTEMCVFWAKHKIFKLDVEDFSTIQIFFVSLKVLEGFNAKKGATKRISKKVLLIATFICTEKMSKRNNAIYIKLLSFYHFRHITDKLSFQKLQKLNKNTF